jgi:hypothetical protein
MVGRGPGKLSTTTCTDVALPVHARPAMFAPLCMQRCQQARRALPDVPERGYIRVRRCGLVRTRRCGEHCGTVGVWMTGRQTMMAWGAPRFVQLQLQAISTATSNGIISAKRRGGSASSWEKCLPLYHHVHWCQGKCKAPESGRNRRRILSGKRQGRHEKQPLSVAACKQWHPNPQTRGVFGSHSAPTSRGSSSHSPPMSSH